MATVPNVRALLAVEDSAFKTTTTTEDTAAYYAQENLPFCLSAYDAVPPIHASSRTIHLHMHDFQSSTCTAGIWDHYILRHENT